MFGLLNSSACEEVQKIDFMIIACLKYLFPHFLDIGESCQHFSNLGVAS